MTFWQSIFLALLQGSTEFLPVSSSGHLAIFENLFGIESLENIALFDIVLHLGTLVAVFIAFRKDIADICVAFGRMVSGKKAVDKNELGSRRMILLIVIATIPLFLVVFLKDTVESVKQYPAVVGAALVVTATLLYISDRIKKGKKNEATATVIDAVIVGVMQSVATVPGLSRSGSTISVGLFRGFDRAFAVKFSFLMSIPAVLGATVLSVKDVFEQGFDPSMMPMFIVGFVIAAVSGYFAIKLIRYIISKDKFGIFAWYCLIVGAATIIITILQNAVNK